MNRIAAVLIAFAWGSVALPAAELSLSSATVEQGSSVTLELKLVGGNDEAAALQCDLRYDFDHFSLAVEPGPAARAAEKSISTSQPESNVLRLAVAGMNRNTMADGVVARITLTARDHESYAGDHTIRITQVAGSSKDAVAIPMTANEARVRIVARTKQRTPREREERK